MESVTASLPSIESKQDLDSYTEKDLAEAKVINLVYQLANEEIDLATAISMAKEIDAQWEKEIGV
jgi:hypothetical protein